MSAGDPRRGDRVPERSRSIAWQTIDGEMVLLSLKRKELLGLNGVGGRIWDLADGTRSIEQIVQCVAAEFDVTAEAAGADASRFLDELIAAGALELRSR